VLRAYKVTVLPMIIYFVSLLGVGFSIGYASAHQKGIFAQLPFDKAHGYWFGTSIGLTITAIFLCILLFKMFRRYNTQAAISASAIK
jgi:MATE family multidrug resistance protein